MFDFKIGRFLPLSHTHDPIDESMMGPLQALEFLPLHVLSIIISQSSSWLQAALAEEIVEYASP